MTVEILVNKISEKSKAENVDLKIAAAMVREDIRVSGELTPEIDENLNKAEGLFYRFLNYPDVYARFAEERFTNLSYEDWNAEMDKAKEAKAKGE